MTDREWNARWAREVMLSQGFRNSLALLGKPQECFTYPWVETINHELRLYRPANGGGMMLVEYRGTDPLVLANVRAFNQEWESEISQRIEREKVRAETPKKRRWWMP